jgi:sensor histidine kinase regulating citrate/malate metabolism
MEISIGHDRLDYIFELTNPMSSISGTSTPEQYFTEGFSTKQKDRGQGLFIVNRITKRLDGNVTVDTSDGKFKVTITIPKYRLEKE